MNILENIYPCEQNKSPDDDDDYSDYVPVSDALEPVKNGQNDVEMHEENGDKNDEKTVSRFDP